MQVFIKIFLKIFLYHFFILILGKILKTKTNNFMNNYRITTGRLRRHIEEQLRLIDETLEEDFVGLISNINLQGRREAFEEVRQLLDICEHDNYFDFNGDSDEQQSNFI
jgi:hypothetical protein